MKEIKQEAYKNIILNTLTISPQINEYINGCLEDNSLKHSFHKIMIFYWKESDEELFDTMSNSFSAMVIPVDYKSEGDLRSFATDNLALIWNIIKKKFMFTYKSSTVNLHIIFNHKSSIHYFEDLTTVEDIVSGVMSSRFKDTWELDLSNFCNDPEFIRCKILIYKLTLLSFYFIYLLLRTDRKTKILNLSNNNLSRIPNEIFNLFAKENLTDINLSNNNISELQITSKTIERLWLEGNPICDTIEDAVTYVRLMTLKFPKLKELDGIKVNQNGFKFPSFRSYPNTPNNRTRETVDQFLRQYYTFYDTKRSELIYLYEESATLSITLDFLGAVEEEASRQRNLRQEALQKAARKIAARQKAERRKAARQEAARQEAARQEAARQEAARLELHENRAEKGEASQAARVVEQGTGVVRRRGTKRRKCHHKATGQKAARLLAARQKNVQENGAEKGEAARVVEQGTGDVRQLVVKLRKLRKAARQEAARQQAARQEAARQEAARQKTARQEAALQKAARQEAARQKAAHQEAARQKAARQKAARQEAARQEAARKETALQKAARQEAIRQEAAGQEAARLEAARQEAALQKATRQEVMENDAINQAIKRYYSLELNCNMLPTNETSNGKQRGNVFVGRSIINRLLCKLPKSLHDPTTFTVDVLNHDDDSLIIVVEGIFKLTDQKQKYYFRRSFVLTIMTGPLLLEYLICNDMFYMCPARMNQKKNSFKSFDHRLHPPAKVLINPGPEEVEALCKVFIDVTHLTPAEAERCLMESGWDLSMALRIFIIKLKNGKIPPSSFSITIIDEQENGLES